MPGTSTVSAAAISTTPTPPSPRPPSPVAATDDYPVISIRIPVHPAVVSSSQSGPTRAPNPTSTTAADRGVDFSVRITGHLPLAGSTTFLPSSTSIFTSTQDVSPETMTRITNGTPQRRPSTDSSRHESHADALDNEAELIQLAEQVSQLLVEQNRLRHAYSTLVVTTGILGTKVEGLEAARREQDGDLRKLEGEKQVLSNAYEQATSAIASALAEVEQHKKLEIALNGEIASLRAALEKAQVPGSTSSITPPVDDDDHKDTSEIESFYTVTHSDLNVTRPSLASLTPSPMTGSPETSTPRLVPRVRIPSSTASQTSTCTTPSPTRSPETASSESHTMYSALSATPLANRTIRTHPPLSGTSSPLETEYIPSEMTSPNMPPDMIQRWESELNSLTSSTPPLLAPTPLHVAHREPPLVHLERAHVDEDTQTSCLRIEQDDEVAQFRYKISGSIGSVKCPVRIFLEDTEVLNSHGCLSDLGLNPGDILKITLVETL